METKLKKAISVDDYIKNFPPRAQQIMEAVRSMVHNKLPEVQEVISYGMPAFKHHGILFYYAAYKRHIGFYPVGGNAIDAFKKELKSYKQGKGSIQFPLDREIPMELIGKIIDYRIEQNQLKANKK